MDNRERLTYRVMVRLPERYRAILAELSQRETRSLVNMLRILIEEGAQRRQMTAQEAPSGGE